MTSTSDAHKLHLIMERVPIENNTANDECTEIPKYPNTKVDQQNQQVALRGSSDIESQAQGNHSHNFDIMDMLAEYEMSVELSDLGGGSQSIADVVPADAGASLNVSEQAYPHTSNNIGGNDHGGDNGGDPILVKHRMIGKLIGFVETLNAQHEFCEFFNRKLVEYFRAHRRCLNVKPIDTKESPEYLKRRFATCIAYLDSLISSDPCAIKILEDCFAKFHASREELFNLATSGNAANSNRLGETLESLIADEPNPIVRHSLRYEIKTLNEIRANMQSIQSELKSNENKTATIYATMLTKIHTLLTKINEYEPHPIASTSNFVVTRMNAFTLIKNNISNDIRNLRNQVEVLKTEVEEKEKRARENTTYGRIVQINIMKSRREQREQTLRSQSQSHSQFQSRYQSQSQSQSIRIPHPFRNAYNMTTPPSRSTSNRQHGRLSSWYPAMNLSNNDSSELH